jgi:hypothetical protein
VFGVDGVALFPQGGARLVEQFRFRWRLVHRLYLESVTQICAVRITGVYYQEAQSRTDVLFLFTIVPHFFAQVKCLGVWILHLCGWRGRAL